MYLARLEGDLGRNQDAYEVFVAMTDDGQRLGKCSILSYRNEGLLPDCPYNIYIDMDTELESVDMLMGAALASVKVLHRGYPNLDVRVYTGCSPDDQDMQDALRFYGFKLDDRERGMIKRLHDDPMTVELPQGMSYIADRLDSREDTRRALERINSTFGESRSEEWLEQLKNEPGFRRIAAVNIRGVVGEALVYSMDQVGLVAMVTVDAKERRKGVAQFLLECARLHFVSMGLKYARADVWDRLLPARRLFEHCGYFAEYDTWYYPGFYMQKLEGELS